MRPTLVRSYLLQLHAHQSFSAEIIVTQNLLLCEATPQGTYIRGQYSPKICLLLQVQFHADTSCEFVISPLHNMKTYTLHEDSTSYLKLTVVRG